MGYVGTCVFLLLSVFFCETTVYCASISVTSSCQSAQSKPKGFGTAKCAIIIGVDGLGGAHLRNVTDYFPTFRSFFEQGSYTTRARGIFPTSSGPNWSSYLTGLDIMQHGVFENTWAPTNGDPNKETDYSIPPVTGRGRPDTIFSQVKKKDPTKQTAMMFTWEWLKNFAVNNSDIDVWLWGGEGVTCGSDETKCYHLKDTNTALSAKANLVKNDPILTFIHLDIVDLAGHNAGWGSPLYYRALKSVEGNIKLVLDALNKTQDSTGQSMLDGAFIVIVSDHGGWLYDHSHYTQPFSALVDIPILIRGPNVLKNNSLESSYVSNLDVATTVLNAIGVDKSEFMRGRVLQEIYP